MADANTEIHTTVKQVDDLLIAQTIATLHHFGVTIPEADEFFKAYDLISKEAAEQAVLVRDLVALFGEDVVRELVGVKADAR